MRNKSLPLIFILCLFLMWVGSSVAQVPEGPVTDEDFSNKLKALKIELEELRQNRDKIIAARWDDKRKQNEAREKYNEEYEVLKDKLEIKSQEKERLREEIETLLRDIEEIKAKREGEKTQFLGLSGLQQNIIQEYSSQLGKRFPVLIPERQQAINEVNSGATLKREKPQEILKTMVGFYKQEVLLTREITAEKKGFLLSDYSPGMGLVLRVGGMASAYLDEKTQKTGLLLRTTNSSGRLYAWREDIIPEAKKVLNENIMSLEKGEAKMLLLPMDVLRTQFAGEGYTKGEAKSIKSATVSFFKNGGIWMWPLAAIALAALLLLIERLVVWGMKNRGSIKTLDKVIVLTQENKIKEAIKLCRSNPKSSAMNAVLDVLKNKDRTREMAEKELQEILMVEGPSLEKRLATISVLGAAAPLLGLLGTVAGMIGMFDSITMHGTSDPKLMASDISIALITTQTGLAIAVPVMIAHNFLANRVDGLINKMETYALKALNTLWPNG